MTAVATDGARSSGVATVEGTGSSTRARHAAPRAFLPPQVWVLTSLVGYVGLITVVYWPGQMDADSLDEIHEAASGHFTNIHTPVLSALWRVPYLMGIQSPGWVLAVGLLVMLVGLYLVLRVRFGRVVSTGVAMVLCSWPPVLSWAVHVGRDEWFTASLLCAFGFAARMARMGRHQRAFNLVAALFMTFVCAASWQIAVFPLLPCFFVLAVMLLPRTAPHRALVSCGVALVCCLGMYGVQLGAQKAIHTAQAYNQQATFDYDLAQLSKMEGKVLFPSDMLRESPREAMAVFRTLTTGEFNQIVFDNLGTQPPVYFLIDGRREASLQQAWTKAIRHDPTGYLQVRTKLLLVQLAITQPSNWTFQVPPDPAGFNPLARALQDTGIRYLGLFSSDQNLWGDVLYSVWFYLLVSIAAVPILLWRRGPGDGVVAGLAVAAVLLTLAIWFTIPAMNYRYSYGIVVTGCAIAPVLWPRRRHVAPGALESGRGRSQP